jgi:membrane protease YdiL (CAAX protease family)
MNAVTQNHAMTTLGLGRTWWETILFAVGILVWIPWMEEFLFRRLLLRAAMRQAWVAAGLCIFAGCIAGVSAAVQPVGPILWVIGTILGLLVVWRFVPRRRRRTILGLGSTSLLFAAMHASVWPSPVPLFFLALALGWVYLRTGRLAGAILLHGLFNSVAWIYLALTVSQG